MIAFYPEIFGFNNFGGGFEVSLRHRGALKASKPSQLTKGFLQQPLRSFAFQDAHEYLIAILNRCTEQTNKKEQDDKQT